MRIDNRKKDQLRRVKVTRNYTKYAEGSVYIEVEIQRFYVDELFNIK